MADNLIDNLASGFRRSQVLFAACELGVFSVIGRDSLDPNAISTRLNANRRGTRILLEALAGLGLLRIRDGRYENTPPVLEHLLPDSPEPRLAQMRHNARLYQRWSGLARAVEEGGPVAGAPPTPEERREFARAMADSAQVSARLTAEAIDLERVGRMLDIGGGPGVFAGEFIRRKPDLEVTILDHADTLEVTRERVLHLGLENRITLKPGDAFESDLGAEFDLILISNVVHIFSSQANQRLVARAAAALAPGGRLVLKDFFLDAGRSGPQWSLLFAVNMLVATQEGDCYTEEEAERWMTSAGLLPVQRIPLTEQTRILIARRPVSD